MDLESPVEGLMDQYNSWSSSPTRVKTRHGIDQQRRNNINPEPLGSEMNQEKL